MLWSKPVAIGPGGNLLPIRDAQELTEKDGIPARAICDTLHVLVTSMSIVVPRTDCQSLPDAEITAELPVLQSTFDRGWGELDGVQSFKYVYPC